MKKVYKKIEQDNGTVTIYGCNRWQKICMKWDKEKEEYISYVLHYGRVYYLDQFMRINSTGWSREFHGCHNDTFFSSVLIKLSDCGEAAKVYTALS